MPNKKHYDWNLIQQDYDNGLSYRDIENKYGPTQYTISKAKKRGDLKTRSQQEACLLYFKHHPPHVMGDEARKKTSDRMSKNNPGGKSKWFEINGKRVQGTWELNFAIYCNKNKIEWERCKPWKYLKDGKEKNYTPDFYIPAKDLYIEIKGYWWGNDKEKMDAIISQHPDKKILIIEKEQYKKILEGELVW